MPVAREVEYIWRANSRAFEVLREYARINSEFWRDSEKFLIALKIN